MSVHDMAQVGLVLACMVVTFWIGYEFGANKDK